MEQGRQEEKSFKKQEQRRGITGPCVLRGHLSGSGSRSLGLPPLSPRHRPEPGPLTTCSAQVAGCCRLPLGLHTPVPLPGTPAPSPSFMPKPRHRRLQELFSVSPRIGSGGLCSPRPPLPRLSSGRAPLLLLARHLCEARARAACALLERDDWHGAWHEASMRQLFRV